MSKSLKNNYLHQELVTQETSKRSVFFVRELASSSQFSGSGFSKQQLRAYSNDLENWNEKQEASERSVPFVRDGASSSQFFGGNFSKQQLRAYSNDLENWNEKQEASERSVPFVREGVSSSQFFGGNFSKQQLRAYSNDLENWNEKQEASERSVPFVRESASSSQFFGGNFSKQQSMVVITNITPDHLDRYDDVASYVKSKEKILIKDALKIIGINSPISKDIYSSLKDKGEGGVIPISVLESVENGVFYDKNTDCLVDNTGENNTGENNTGKKEVIFPMALLPNLVGMHNKENIAIAYAVCKALAVDGDSIIRALESFKGLAHRMEYVGSYKNISFYNDSKATNITSALASLSSFQNIIWFAGGKFKENSFESLIPILKNIKMAYFFGESKNLFANFFENNQNNNYQICLNLEEAFDKALEYSLKTEEKLVFLLAPACSSYDQFRDFEERGKLFVKMVQSIVF